MSQANTQFCGMPDLQSVNYLIAMMITMLVMIVRGAVALVRDGQWFLGRFRAVSTERPMVQSPRKEPRSSSEEVLNLLPQKIVVTMAGTKYHASTCTEVARDRSRKTKSFSPCLKCEAALRSCRGSDPETVGTCTLG